ncbi:sugar transferase [Novosphingobium flavum]|uniref:Sugar transferase n=1 Tax=Novosphingobium flavum TaxID=1778672 RepID=A0A7X1FQT3_9SPHN|nr:sugar transferase [Novosphingobium flavum]MBC2665223.1 sugar transferase [Novosphingobium flavum]
MHGLKIDLEKARSSRLGPALKFKAASDIERQLILADVPFAGDDLDEGALDSRRIFDIVASIALIIILAPVLLLIALMIQLSDPGPLLFAHTRVGRGGRLFRCWKFRSMCVDAETRLQALIETDSRIRAEWERGYKLASDPRVTRVGNWLRVSSLDELPQLVNVLLGSMTLVGPRPVVTAEIGQYGRFAHYYLGLKPGLTGLWQVTGRSSVTYQRRVAADVLYARRRSVGLDLKILAATVPAVLLGRGAC